MAEAQQQTTPKKMRQVVAGRFDINDNTALTELERLKSNPEKYRIVRQESVILPFQYIEYETSRDRSIKVEVRLFDLNNAENLTEIERLKSNPEKYRIIRQETISLPFQYLEYEVY